VFLALFVLALTAAATTAIPKKIIAGYGSTAFTSGRTFTSGIRTPEEARDELASIAADLDHRSGRVWRNLQDTADGVPAMQDAPREWESWRRGLDYYPEDQLTWLWADVIIRQQTHGQKSLDDFCRIFHGPPSGAPQVKTYTFDDVVNTLNQVAAYDWRGFWTERLTNHGPGAPLGGIEGSGCVMTSSPTSSTSEWPRSSNA